MITKTRGNREKIVFLDRDGVINRRVKGYVAGWEDFEFLPGVLGALKSLKAGGYTVIVVSNQAGVNKGILSKKALRVLTDHMVKSVRKGGGEISAVYYCPCRDEDGCSCRKPKPGLLLMAANDYNINLAGAWLVGDEERDILAGQAAGCRTILVRMSGRMKGGKIKPDFFAEDLKGAVRVIRQNDK